MADEGKPTAAPKKRRATSNRKPAPAAATPAGAGGPDAPPVAAHAKDIAFNPRTLMQAYLDGEHERLADDLLAVLQHFRSVTYYQLDERSSYFINAFVKHFLNLFSQEDFLPDTPKLLNFLEHNVTIANITAISEFRNTDAYIKILLSQKKNFLKLLILYSPRNEIRIDRRVFFNTDANFASLWYHAFLENYKTCCASRNGIEHQRFHLQHQNAKLEGVNAFIHHSYFGCTYIDHQDDYRLKQRINKIFRDWPPSKQEIKRKARSSGKPKIGVFTSMWFPRQSVYRTQHPFLSTLRHDYELHLIHLGQERANIDTAMFASVAHFKIQNASDFSAFSPNDFDIAYFPDIGMNIESIFLANLRIAPIQITNYGHPVSTFGSEVDYWIGGQITEVEDRHREHYSERLVLIPGSGQLPVPPDYVLQHVSAPPSPVLVNCSWTGQKINYETLSLLRRAADRAETPVVFRFFPGGSVLSNGYLPLKADIEEILGADRCVVFRDLDYKNYMQAMESGHFGVDSFPFGGCNALIDQYYLRKPIACLTGDRFYNRASIWLAEKAGMEECLCATPAAWVDKIVQLIDDAAYRHRLVKRLRVVDLEERILATDDAAGFKKAIDHILANHDALKAERGRAPIRIG